LRISSETFGMSRAISSAWSLVSRASTVSPRWDRGEHVFLDEPLGQDDRVLVVVALPRHVGDHRVLAERHLALSVEGPSAMTWPSGPCRRR
jgi:hypothetical protein